MAKGKLEPRMVAYAYHDWHSEHPHSRSGQCCWEKQALQLKSHTRPEQESDSARKLALDSVGQQMGRSTAGQSVSHFAANVESDFAQQEHGPKRCQEAACPPSTSCWPEKYHSR